MSMDRESIGKQNSRLIDLLRFPLIAAVIFIHTDLRPYLEQSEEWPVFSHVMQFFIDCLCSNAVPMFFLFSGYLFFRNMDEQPMTLPVYGRKLKSRVRSLLVPYILWNIIYLLAIAVLQRLFPGFSLLLHKQLSTCVPSDFIYIFWDISRITGLPTDQRACLVGQFWFLQCLMVMCLLSPVIYYAVRRLRFLFVVLVAIPPFLGYMPDIPGFHTQALFYFVLGAWLTMERRTLAYTSGKVLVPCAVYVALTGFMGWDFRPFGSELLFMRTFCLAIVINGVTALWLKAHPDARGGELARSTFFIFAMHRFLTASFNKSVFAGFIPVHSDLVALLVNLAGSTVSLYLCLVCYRMAIRLLPRATAVLSGGR